MDPQEIKQEMIIPEPHQDIENAGAYIPTPDISEALADAGHDYDPKTESLNEHLDHLARISDELDKAHGTEIQDPLEESVQQIQNPPEHQPHEIPSTRIDHANTSYPANKPLVKNIASNVGMPFRSVYKGFSSLIKSLLFKHGSSASPVYNGRTTVGDVIELKKEEKGELPILSPVSNSEDYRPQEEMPVPNNVTPIDDFRQSEVKNAA